MENFYFVNKVDFTFENCSVDPDPKSKICNLKKYSSLFLKSTKNTSTYFLLAKYQPNFHHFDWTGLDRQNCPKFHFNPSFSREKVQSVLSLVGEEQIIDYHLIRWISLESYLLNHVTSVQRGQTRFYKQTSYLQRISRFSSFNLW